MWSGRLEIRNYGYRNRNSSRTAVEYIFRWYITSTSYNIGNSADRKDLATVLWSGRRKCVHQVRKRKSDSKDLCEGKNVNCPAGYSFTLYRNKRPSSGRGYCLVVDINYQHNHPTFSMDSLRFQNVSEETKQIYEELFKCGYSASKSHQIFEKKLEETHGVGNIAVSSNTAYNPTYRWVFKSHTAYMLKNFGKINSIEAYKLAQEKVAQYNAANAPAAEAGGTQEKLCALEQDEDGSYYMACCDPLSRRVLEMLPQSSDLLLIDATANLDRGDSKFFRLLTCSPAGGLPVGYLVVSSETEELIYKALQLYKSILPSHAFKGRGKDVGPVVILTDDSSAEQSAIR